jgi:PAS domain S-box-containing protein
MTKEAKMIGSLPENVLEALLETLPVEFSVVDADDRVLAWNKHESRIFRRPTGVVGKSVQNCHPKKSLQKVEQILQEMKAGTRDKARFWIDLTIDGEKQKVLIEYYALRDSEGNYLGCLEASQNIQELQALTGEKRLLD